MALERLLGYKFKAPQLLNEALTHVSAAAMAGTTANVPNNERLEFLGDRVLGLIIAEALYRRFPDAREGGLAPRLNALVRKETLAEVASKIGLAPHLRLGFADGAAGGRAHKALLADSCEAVIGALYLDGGLEAATDFVLRHWQTGLGDVNEIPQDAKTALQEWAQARGLEPPTYKLAAKEGPDHEPVFRVAMKLKGHRVANGEGRSKRAAEQAAASAFLRREGIWTSAEE